MNNSSLALKNLETFAMITNTLKEFHYHKIDTHTHAHTLFYSLIFVQQFLDMNLV